jgi:protein-tyrosine-phosphatase
MKNVGADLPSSVLFCCTYNAIRSPMAAGLLRWLHGRHCFVDSAGVRSADEVDPFAVMVMREVGVDIANYQPKDFADLDDTSFDVIITLSREALDQATDRCRTTSCEVEFWSVSDPSQGEGSRDSLLDAYRRVRDELKAHIQQRFPPQDWGQD